MTAAIPTPAELRAERDAATAAAVADVLARIVPMLRESPRLAASLAVESTLVAETAADALRLAGWSVTYRPDIDRRDPTYYLTVTDPEST